MADLVLSATNLEVHYQVRGASIKAIDGVSLSLFRGGTLGVLGESGSGKSTLARTLLLLVKPKSGSIWYHSPGAPPVDLAVADRSVARPYRRRIQAVFQNASGSLDPKMTLAEILAEPLIEFDMESRATVRTAALRLLAAVGLPAEFAQRTPRQLSGGESQRVAIARAIGTHPEVIIADEPTSALDVRSEVGIVRLLHRLQDELGFAVLFITHSLRAVRPLANQLAVMHAGEVVEVGPTAEIETRPLAPYTRALISSTPVLDPARDRRRAQFAMQAGNSPPVRLVSGCRFHPRCPWSIPECAAVRPELREVLPDRLVACIRINASEPDIERAEAKGLGVLGKTDVKR